MNFALKDKILIFCLSILLIFLPINTVLVQFFTVKLGLIVWFSLWKEVFASVIILIILYELLHNILKQKLRQKAKNLKFLSVVWRTYLPLVLVEAMTLVGILNSVGKVPLNFFIFGFRFELFWVWFWCVLAVYLPQRLYRSGTQDLDQKSEFTNFFQDLEKPQSFLLILRKNLLNSTLTGYFLTVIFSLITIIFGVENTLSFFGYGNQATGSGSELLFTQPVGHLIDAGGWNSSFRLSGSFSSPNHFAGYLMLLLPLFLLGVLTFKILDRKDLKLLQGTWFQKLESRGFWWFCLLLDLVFLALTFARYSYLALFVIFSSLSLIWAFEKSKTSTLKLKYWIKNSIFSLILVLPILISVIILNLPIALLQKNVPSFLAKPSSTEWHQQHTAAAWRALTLQIHPELSQKTELTSEQRLKIQNLNSNSQNLTDISYRLLTGYGLGSTDPASKYLSLEQNPIVKLGFGLDDELYFAREMDRPLALTPENWFLGMWVRGGVFYMLFFLAIWLYFMRDIRQIFDSKLVSIFQNPKVLLEILLAMSLFGLFIGAFLLDIFDSQSFALLIGPIYLMYRALWSTVPKNCSKLDFNTPNQL